METLLALLVGVLFAGGVFLVLERSLLRFVFGLLLLSNAVNLLLFAGGRVAGRMPPVVAAGAPVEAMANPLPQALVLTAVVIGFGLAAFTLALVARGWDALGTLDPGGVSDEEVDGEVFPAGAAGRPREGAG